MRKQSAVRLFGIPLVVALIAPAVFAQAGRGAVQPPTAKKVPHQTPIHGRTLKDDYFWLREKSNPEVIKHLEAENAYTEEVMAPTKGLQETLYREMLGRIKQTDLSVPMRTGEYYYYSRTEEGRQYPYRCRRKGSMSGTEEILLDLNRLAEGHSYLDLSAFIVSDDGNLLAYSTDTTGYRQYTLHIKDLRTGGTLGDPYCVDDEFAVVLTGCSAPTSSGRRRARSTCGRSSNQGWTSACSCSRWRKSFTRNSISTCRNGSRRSAGTCSNPARLRLSETGGTAVRLLGRCSECRGAHHERWHPENGRQRRPEGGSHLTGETTVTRFQPF